MNKTPPSPPVTPRFERDPAFLDTYANQLRLNANLSDFTLVFSVSEDLGPDHFAVRDKVAVHLPPTVAKILLAQLRVVIDAYEKAIAPIPVPRDLDAHVETTKTHLEAMLAQIVHAKPFGK